MTYFGEQAKQLIESKLNGKVGAYSIRTNQLLKWWPSFIHIQ